MSQHDMVIDNGPKGDVGRVDFSAALQALASKNSGPGEPSTKYDYMDWPDTNTGYLKQWNPGEGAFAPVRGLDPRILTSAASGGAAYAVTFVPAINGFVAGIQYFFRADVANTGACTFNANGVGAVAIKKLLGGAYVDLVIDDIPANHLCFMIYSATLGAMVLLNPNRAAITSAAIKEAYSNLVVPVASNTTYTLSADEVIVKDASGNPMVLGPLNLTSLDLSQAGSIGVANGIKSAVLGASVWYFPYLVAKSDGTAALWLDTSSTIPTPPTGYTYWYRLHGLKTDSSSHLIYKKQTNNKSTYTNTGTGFPLIASGLIGSVSVPTYVPTSISPFVPPTAREIGVLLHDAAGTFVVAAPNANFGAVASTNPPPVYAAVGGSWPAIAADYLVLESTNIYIASYAASAYWRCTGWIESL